MDITRLPGSGIVTIARAAFAMPDVSFLCFGESDLPSPGAALEAARSALDAGETRYSDVRGLPPLRGALAAYLSTLHRQPVTETRMQVTASGMAAVSIAFAATIRAGDRVVIQSPLWPNIANALRLRGALVDPIDLRQDEAGRFHLDLDALAAKLVGARALVINSPNNPTGWTATLDELRAILDLTRRLGVWLISDEVYTRLIYSEAAAAPSLLDIAEPDDRVLVCNSFSKTWIMTGWRLGWLVTPEGTRDAFAEIVEVSHSGVAPFVQRAGVAAIHDAGAVAALRAHCALGRALAGEALAGLNFVRYTPPEGAFYAFIGIDGVNDSQDLALRLVMNHKVAVAPGSAFGPAGEGSLRVCFAQSEPVMRTAMARLRDGLRAELGA
jgi:aspartate/methionine/tyrosine aminotransferase